MMCSYDEISKDKNNHFFEKPIVKLLQDFFVLMGLLQFATELGILERAIFY